MKIFGIFKISISQIVIIKVVQLLEKKKIRVNAKLGFDLFSARINKNCIDN